MDDSKKNARSTKNRGASMKMDKVVGGMGLKSGSGQGPIRCLLDGMRFLGEMLSVVLALWILSSGAGEVWTGDDFVELTGTHRHLKQQNTSLSRDAPGFSTELGTESSFISVCWRKDTWVEESANGISWVITPVIVNCFEKHKEVS